MTTLTLKSTSIRVVLAAALLCAMAVTGQQSLAQNDDTFNIPGSCVREDASANPVVRAGVPTSAVSGGIVGCTIIHNGDRFVRSPAAIGNLGVIQRGVQAAVDVYGIAGGGGVVQFGQQIQVCLRGTGDFIYMSAVNTPRIPAELPAVTRDVDGELYTCGLISTTGTAILVAGEQAPLADSADVLPGNAEIPAETVTDEDATADSEDTEGETDDTPQVSTTASGTSVVSLTGCRVTTTAMVRMRDEPTTQGSTVLDRLPYELSLQAVNRTADESWYNVIYRDQNGWVSGTYLNTSAGCDD